MSVHGSRVRSTAERTSSASIGRGRTSQTPIGGQRTTSATTPATGATLNGDQLLCKCLEKGHEILRKVEELTTVVSPALRIRTVSRITSSTAAHHPPAMPAGQRKATTIPTAKAPPSGAVQSTSVMTQTAHNGVTNTSTSTTTTTSSTGGTIPHQKQQPKAPKTTPPAAGGGAGEKKATTGGGGTVTKVMGRAATTLSSSSSSPSARLLATVDSSRRLAAGKAPSLTTTTTTESAAGRLSSPGSIVRSNAPAPRTASSGPGGKPWPKPSALTVAPPPLKSPALVKQNKGLLQPSKPVAASSTTTVTASPLLFSPPSRTASLSSFLSTSSASTINATASSESSSSASGLGGGDEKQKPGAVTTESSDSIVSSAATVPLITPGHDGGGDDDDDDGRPETPPKIVIMAGVNSSAALTGIVGAKVTKDNTYHESDWSEDSGRMSNEHLDLLDGCSGGAGSGGSSGADTGSSSGEQEKPPRGVGVSSRVNAASSTPVVVGKLDESLLGIFEPSSSPANSPPTGEGGFAGGRWNRSPVVRPGRKVNSSQSSPSLPAAPPPSSSPPLSTATATATVSSATNNHQQRQPIITISDDSEQVFFRSGVLGALEAKRDELLSDRVIQLQAHCRGYLARRRLARRRLQELAVRCIQRNVRAFLKVRDWPWWRLLVRVMPLLAVHRTEEQLVAATAELQQVRAKLEKIEAERNELKAANHKLEARLSDVTSELTEEHSSSNLITERLASETSERLRLEKEVKEYEAKYRNLQESSEKMEMELLCAKSELNYDFDDCSTFGGSEYDAGDIGTERGDGGLVDAGEVVKNYRQRYERVARELEFTKKRLQTQHEHDLEQLVGLKKQLEKKLADAYEQVEEQRSVVAQWKRKAQKMTNEMNDLRLLYEEQSSRNNVLEKRQRKFDAECQTFQDSARQERQAKERLAREKDVLVAEKCKLEQDLSDVRLELELKEEKNAALQTELDEMMFGGGTEEEIAQLKRQKLELDRRCKEQDEELDEMAGQIQLLEQAKLRLEMSLETTRKEARKEAQQRDDEMEEIRGASYKKVKSLECQLEQEHEERTLLLREKHELERRLSSLEDQDRAERAAEDAMVQKLKRDNRKYRALLRDAQSQLERAKGDSAGKALVRQLRNQLEDAESARAVAVKARQTLEVELQDAQMLIEETARARNEAEDKASVALRDRTELQGQLDENEEELAELMKKYSAMVKQLTSEQALIAEYELRLSELEGEKRSLKEQLVELAARLESVETIGDSSNSMQFKRLELRTKELESRLEFEQATRARIEIQLNRHKDSLEKMQGDLSQARAREAQAQDAVKKAQKTIRELREELSALGNRDQEHMTKRKELEKRIETAESETASARADLRLALQRIADLQQAMEEEGDSYHSDSDASDSSSSMDSFHESTVTRKSSSVGSGVGGSLDPFGATNGSRGNGSLVGGTRDGRKESNNPRIRTSLIGSVRRKKRLHPTIKEEDEGFETDELATGKSSPSGSDQRSSTLSPTEDKEPHHQLDADQLSPDRDIRLETNQVDQPPLFTTTGPSSMPDGQAHGTVLAADGSATVADGDGACNDQSDFPFDINTLKSIKEKIHSLNQIIRDESHDSGTSEIDLVDLKNLKNQIHEFKKAIECSRSRSMEKLVSNGGGTPSVASVHPAAVIKPSASTGSAATPTIPDGASFNGV
ncbi:uncharacterized protein LOC118466598 isoform X5 [Anopheles albimanus]|uniref:uncharacterized protein LOC118466598 isoform X5 n=1 Tax=Anopheles albimanus TaxID=7167 RepID=UPI00164142DD|nr:uncharacterized protein LOC118466598 isoform X5 [Anopheles albimanus]XP_035792069.1 uncharacterized protein LOC118466598 isoform X5 [Anopheles albimanus]XP_035792070.1 uncharacterized protein LOC118466598 isoform X5 [Anopheles albimanus]